MLSDKIIAMLQGLKALERSTNEAIIKETGHKYRLCTMPDIQLWVDSEANQTLEDIEALVGPLKFDYETERHIAYTFKLGTVNGTILVDKVNTSDSRGESDDVSSNEEA